MNEKYYPTSDDMDWPSVAADQDNGVNESETNQEPVTSSTTPTHESMTSKPMEERPSNPIYDAVTESPRNWIDTLSTEVVW